MMQRPIDDPEAWSTASEWETDPDRLCAPITLRMQRGDRVPPDALDGCYAEAEARVARRTAAAPQLRWEDVSAIPEPYMLPEERARFAELAGTPPTPRALTYDEQREEKRARLARRHDVRWLRPAWSAAYCAYVDMSAQSKQAHDGKDRDYARSMKTIALRLHDLGVTPLSCRDPQTVRVRRCMSSPAQCSRDVLDVVTLVPPIYP